MQPQEDTSQPQQPEQPQSPVSPPANDVQPDFAPPQSSPAFTESAPQQQPDVVAPPAPIAAPIQPQPQPVVGSSPLPAGPPSSNKKLFIILGAILGALVLLGIIGWTVYAMLFAVSKADYAAAATAMNSIQSKASSAYNDITTLSYVSSYGTEVKATNDINAARSSIKELKAENDKFKDLRALRDSEVKKAYDTYISQFAKFNTYSAGILDSMEGLLPALIKCDDTSTLSTSNMAAYQAALTDCISSLEDAQDLSDPDLKTLSSATLAAMKAVKGALDELATLSSSNYQRASEIRQSIYDAQDTYTDATTTARSNLEKRGKEAEIKDAYNALAALLNDKQFK